MAPKYRRFEYGISGDDPRFNIENMDESVDEFKAQRAKYKLNGVEYENISLIPEKYAQEVGEYLEQYPEGDKYIFVFHKDPPKLRKAKLSRVLPIWVWLTLLCGVIVFSEWWSAFGS
ncbi:hypothetical protein ACJJIF_04010 [Microbulbifer sp. SSSA002]|uniref:hypothetical protein n=1 Tax=unclassified Microbulbifer TaxID=2619833 RepID=UPI0026138D7A|nr:hypothetical protein [uncultured Microbulbifer sp.]